MEQQQNQNYLTAQQVADRWSVARQEVYRLVRIGQLAAIRLNERRLRFDPRDIDAFEEARRVNPGRAA